MKQEEMKQFLDTLSSKLGEENISLISDDLAMLNADNMSMNNALENANQEKEKLKSEKDNLLKVNGNLFQQITLGKEETPNNEEKKETKPFSFKTIFDEKGNFIK